MPFKASNAVPAERYERAKRIAVQLKQQSQSRSNAWASGATAAEILSAADHLNAFRTQLAAMAQTPGIAAYAQSQEDDPAYDVVAEFNALLATIDAAISEIVTTIPKDGNDWLLIYKINADGSLSPRNFNTGQLNTLRSRLDDITAAVV